MILQNLLVMINLHQLSALVLARPAHQPVNPPSHRHLFPLIGCLLALFTSSLGANEPAASPSAPRPETAPSPTMSATNVADSVLKNTAGISVAGLDSEMLAAMMESLDDRQKLGAGDRLVYRVLEDKEPPKSLIVGDAGELDVPYFGLVPAATKTCRQLAKEVRSALEKQLYRQATVIIALELVNKKRSLGKVYVVGQVRVTGQLDIPDDEEFTVSKAIMKSGGFSDFADRKKVRLVRMLGKTEKQTLIINVADIWEKGKVENDLKLVPDDTIFVPARLVNF